MVALLRHQPTRQLPVQPDVESPRPALRLLPGGSETASPSLSQAVAADPIAPGSSGPTLRLVPNGAGGSSVARPGVVAVLVVAVVVFGLLGLLRIVQAPPGSAVPTPDPTPGVAPVASEADRVVIVAPGDTLWSIGAELSPGSDPRPAVAALIEANGGDSLQIGQQIVIPSHLLD